MRVWFRHISIIVVAMASFNAMADEAADDMVCLYNSWEQMFLMEPDTVLVNPMVDICTPYEVYIETGERKLDKKIRMDYIAASLGNNTWVINSEYLKKAFRCRRNNIQGYVPVFFTDKTAFVTSRDIEEVPGFEITQFKERYFYIDFESRNVTKITSKSLNRLLEDYSDLQQRFAGMNDGDDDRVLKTFFLLFIERASEDPARPDILDLMGG